jgi:transposase
MRPPARIKNWLGLEAMFQWVQSAPDQAAYRCRMCIWLTHTGKLHAAKVAHILGVSKQAVWLWIRQYNELGPAGLERHGRGGRRWGLMTLTQETELLRPFFRRLRLGHALKPDEVKWAIEAKLQRNVSKSYVYKLLKRHGWTDILGQSRPAPSPSEASDTFGRLAKPWLREP